jgi:hypothetical protein
VQHQLDNKRKLHAREKRISEQPSPQTLPSFRSSNTFAAAAANAVAAPLYSANPHGRCAHGIYLRHGTAQ